MLINISGVNQKTLYGVITSHKSLGLNVPTYLEFEITAIACQHFKTCSTFFLSHSSHWCQTNVPKTWFHHLKTYTCPLLFVDECADSRDYWPAKIPSFFLTVFISLTSQHKLQQSPTVNFLYYTPCSLPLPTSSHFLFASFSIFLWTTCWLHSSTQWTDLKSFYSKLYFTIWIVCEMQHNLWNQKPKLKSHWPTCYPGNLGQALAYLSLSIQNEDGLTLQVVLKIKKH